MEYEVSQDPANDQLFSVIIYGGQAWLDAQNEVRAHYGSAPSPRLQRSRDRHIVNLGGTWAWRHPVVVYAQELGADAEVAVAVPGAGFRVTVTFTDRSAAMLFKLRYC